MGSPFNEYAEAARIRIDEQLEFVAAKPNLERLMVVDSVLLTPDEPAPERTFRSRAAHAGEDASSPSRPLSAPIHQNSVYAFADSHLADAAFAAGDPLYARDGLPNARALERAVADLEGSEDAHAVSSGMAAIALTLFALLSSGDHVIVPSDCYCDTRALFTEHFARFGVTASFIDSDDLTGLRAAINPRTALIFAETISNPGMELSDIPGIANIASAAGAVFMVDNTFATPALCRPLEHGADLVAHSAGKLLSGHHDVTAGVIAGSSALIARIKRAGYLTGALLGPMDAWLALRGMKTLAPRMAWASQAGEKVARFLSVHPAVSSVRYPGLPSPRSRELTTRLLPAGAGGILAFDLAGGASAAANVIHDLKTIPYVPSVGGTTTTVSYPPQVPKCLSDGTVVAQAYASKTIRLSIGLEDPVDIIADLRAALDRAAATQFGQLSHTGSRG